jgi:hypothetical protein
MHNYTSKECCRSAQAAQALLELCQAPLLKGCFSASRRYSSMQRGCTVCPAYLKASLRRYSCCRGAMSPLLAYTPSTTIILRHRGALRTQQQQHQQQQPGKPTVSTPTCMCCTDTYLAPVDIPQQPNTQTHAHALHSSTDSRAPHCQCALITHAALARRSQSPTHTSPPSCTVADAANCKYASMKSTHMLCACV